MSKKTFTKKYNSASNPLNPNPSIESWASDFPEWDGESGDNVLEFIKSLLENSVVDLDFVQSYGSNTNPHVLGKNAFGETVCATQAVIAEPVYAYNIKINKVTVGSFEFNASDATSNVNLSYSSNLTATANITIETIQTVAGVATYIQEARQYSIYWIDSDGTRQTTLGSINSQQVNSGSQGASFTVDISNMFTKGFNNLRLVAELVDSAASGNKDIFAKTDTFSGTVFYETQIVLSKPTSPLSVSTTANPNAFTLQISGIDATDYGYYQLEYYEYDESVEDVKCTKQKSITLTSASQVQLTLAKGIHYIYARVKRIEDSVIQGTSVTIASDWVLMNLLVQTSETLANEGAAVISEIPTSLTNCNATKLYRVCTTDERSCALTINAYLATTNQNIESADNLFNSLSLDLLSTDDGIDKSYYTYIELNNISSSNNRRYGKFGITDANNKTTWVPQFSVSGTTVSANEIFVFNVEQPETNISNRFNYDTTSNPILNFSQISRGNVFNSDIINPNLSSSDGWTTDEDSEGANYTVFKVSPTDLGLFVNSSATAASPLALLNSSGNSLLGDNQNFSIEVMLKSEYINDMDDEIMSIGNIRFYPGYLGIYNETTGTIDDDSRADYQREEPTHILITYTLNYRPSTYSDMYNSLLTNYSTQSPTYNCLKIYINGVINREVMVAPSQLFHNSEFSMLVAPENSNVLFYIFRTYETALNYTLIQKNRISAFLHLTDKETFYNNNNILFTESDGVSDKVGQISLEKCLGKYNVILVAQKAGDSADNTTYTDRPLYWNNKDLSIKATLLVKYADTNLKKYGGKLYGGKIKAQGSSAKKYLIHNTSYSKFKFVPEYNDDDSYNSQFETPGSGTYNDYYVMPPYASVDASGNATTITPTQHITKLVGKVNYASSMQSHKPGACKLYNDVFTSLYPGDTMNGGRKTVLEEPFLYFFVTVSDLENVTWEDVYDTATFMGFQTWGSAKGDAETWGYNKKTTPEYLLVEGADNQSMGANFKVPWAAFQRWDDISNYLDENGRVPTTYDHESHVKQLNYQVTGLGDYTTGLIIYDETIQYQTSGADAFDIDFGLKVYSSAKLVEDSETEYEDSLYYKFTTEAKTYSLPKFASLVNLLYLFDYANYVDIPTSGSSYTGTVWADIWKSNSTSDNRFYRNISTVGYYNKLIIPYDCNIYTKVTAADGTVTETNTNLTAKQGDVFRWDTYDACWVPAGLHYEGTSWRTLNVVDLYNRLYALRTGATTNNNTLGSVVEEDIKDLFTNYSQYFTSESGNTFIYFQGGFANDTYYPNASSLTTLKHALADLFKAACLKYLGVEDVKYHQAFIRYVSGTDNRAKNTYFQIQGRIYKKYYEYTEVTTGADADTTYYDEDHNELVNDNGTLKTSADSEEEYTGKFYTRGEEQYIPSETLESDVYKIKCKQDDLDTIFATDNNGQQVKPYYLLEPPYNHDTEDMWGDMRSALFYNFDITYSNDIITTLGQFISRATPSSVKFDASSSMIKKYFLNIQETLPAVAYNHMAEIYYETAQSLYQGSGLTSYGLNSAGLRTIDEKSFNNNSVAYPLSLSHGSCYESELQFLNDRFKFLNTMCNAGYISSNTMSLITGTGSSGNTIDFKGTASYTQYLYPSFGSGTSATKSIDQTYSDITQFTYDSMIPELYDATSNANITILKQAIPNSTYNFENLLQQTVTGASIGQTESYKTINITGGLDYLTDLVSFPNASEVIIDGNYTTVTIDDVETKVLGDGNVANYTLNIVDTVVEEKLPCIEKLKLINVTNLQSDAKLDFRGCDRLSELDLTGCSGFTTINLPTSNTLTKVTLPSTLTTLTMDYYPNLTSENFNFDSNTVNLTSLTIDCRNQSELIDKLLKLCSTNTAIELKTSNSSLTINLPKSTINSICNRSNITVTGNLKINVIDSETGETTSISFAEKQIYASKWGDIDSADNSIQLIYTVIPMTTANTTIAKLGQLEVSGPAPVDLQSTGNNFKIVDNLPAITYAITYQSTSGLASINSSTGYITVNSSDSNGTLHVTVQVTTLTSSFTCNARVSSSEATQAYTIVELGFRIPRMGDYAYADGTFSSTYDTSRTIVGIVISSIGDLVTSPSMAYQAQDDTDSTSFEVLVCSKDFVSATNSNKQTVNTFKMGPDSYAVDTSNGITKNDSFSVSQTNIDEQTALMKLLGYMNDSENDGTTTHTPVLTQYQPANSGNTVTGLITYSSTLTVPTSTYSGYNVTLSYVNKAIKNVATLASDNFNGLGTTALGGLTSSNYNAISDKLANLTTAEKYNKSDSVNDSIIAAMSNIYDSILYPAYFLTYNWLPSVKSNETLSSNYTKGKWYIPSNIELNWFIFLKIRSNYEGLSDSASLWTDSSFDPAEANKDSVYGIFDTHVSSWPCMQTTQVTSCDTVALGTITAMSLVYNTMAIDYQTCLPNWQSQLEYVYYYCNNNAYVKRNEARNIIPFCRVTVTKQS